MNIPTSLDQIDAVWLTLALQREHPDTEVAAVSVGEVIHGSLTKALLRIDYDQNPAGLPSTLYLKAAFEEHGIPVSMRSEAMFYDIARPEVEMHAPTAYASVHNEDAGVILMGDLGDEGCTISDPRVPWSVELVRDGLRQLAGLHAQWWGDGRVPGIPDFPGSNAIGAILLAPGYFESCLEGPTGAGVPEGFRDREQTAGWMEHLWPLDEVQPLAFCHGDAHLGNTYVTSDGSAGFLDWGGVKAGHWGREICYFLTGALSIEDRRAHEEDLIREYLTVLASAGADPVPSWDEAWLTYRRHMVHGLNWFLCPIEMQPLDIIMANVERFATGSTDHEAGSLFE